MIKHALKLINKWAVIKGHGIDMHARLINIDEASGIMTGTNGEYTYFIDIDNITMISAKTKDLLEPIDNG